METQHPARIAQLTKALTKVVLQHGWGAALCNVIGRTLLCPGAELVFSWGTAVGVHSLFWRWYVPTCAVFLSAVTPSESPAIALWHSREGT